MMNTKRSWYTNTIFQRWQKEVKSKEQLLREESFHKCHALRKDPMTNRAKRKCNEFVGKMVAGAGHLKAA